jgi:hypothetical protein
MIHVRKMDRRFNGHGTFSHRIEFKGQGYISQFLRVRNWCMEKFGPSAEISLIYCDVFPNTPFWAWESEHSMVIYLRDVAFSQFLLQKESFER